MSIAISTLLSAAATIHAAPKAAPHEVYRTPVAQRQAVERRPAPTPVARHQDNRDHGRDRDRSRPVIEYGHGPVVTVYTPPVYVQTGYTYQPPSSVSLLGATALDGGQVSLDVASELGGRSALDLVSVGSGSTYVSQVVLYFDNGSTQVVPVGQLLNANNPSFQISLGDGACITRVAVAGHSNSGGAIAIDAI